MSSEQILQNGQPDPKLIQEALNDALLLPGDWMLQRITNSKHYTQKTHSKPINHN